VAEGEAVGEAEVVEEGVAEGEALRSVVVSEPVRSAEVFSWSCFAGPVCAGGSSGFSAEASVNPAPAEIAVAARAHAGVRTATVTMRSHPRILP
jgi:hypothetical protein